MQQVLRAADEDQSLEAFRSGNGMGWHEHDHRLFRGTERFFRPGYRASLVAEWIRLWMLESFCSEAGQSQSNPTLAAG
jgi:hypothetical protein